MCARGSACHLGNQATDNGRTIPPRHVDKWDFAAVDMQSEHRREWSEDELLRISAAHRIWNDAQDPRGTIAETYLRSVRCLDLPEELAGSVLRFHPACPWRNENPGQTDRIPALIVPFRSIDDDAITGIHRIALRPDGAKLGRRMLGIVHRAAIKLDSIRGETLAIGEGVETALAARELGFAPAWALGSVGSISFFPLIDDVTCLTLLGETGEASAHAIRFCGKRWRKAGRRVRVAMPKVGSDLNDVLIAERAAQ